MGDGLSAVDRRLMFCGREVEHLIAFDELHSFENVHDLVLFLVVVPILVEPLVDEGLPLVVPTHRPQINSELLPQSLDAYSVVRKLALDVLQVVADLLHVFIDFDECFVVSELVVRKSTMRSAYVSDSVTGPRLVGSRPKNNKFSDLDASTQHCLHCVVR